MGEGANRQIGLAGAGFVAGSVTRGTRVGIDGAGRIAGSRGSVARARGSAEPDGRFRSGGRRRRRRATRADPVPRCRAGALLALEHTRWILFLPVGLGIGIGVYFDLAAEPPAWIAPASGAALLAAAAAMRRRRAAAGFLLSLATICAGAALAQSRAERVAASTGPRGGG